MLRISNRAIGVCERLAIILVALMGVTGNANAAQCTLAWAAIIAGAELARCGVAYNAAAENKKAAQRHERIKT